MRSVHTCVFIALCAVPALSRTRPAVTVAELEGTARVQHDGERQWRGLETGYALSANDMIETSADSRLRLDCAGGNTVVLGGSSRILLDYRRRSRREQGTVRAAQLTLFAGGVLVAIDVPCSASVLTPNASIEYLRGTVSTTADPTTNESGVQVLCGDSVAVRNVAEHDARFVSRGQVSTVRLGAGPTPAQSLSEAHEAVLGALYGMEHVRARLAACGVRSSPDVTGGTGAPEGMDILAGQSVTPKVNRPTTYTRLHRLNDVYGSILADREKSFWFYRPAAPRGPLFPNAGVVRVGAGTAIADGQAHTSVTVTPSYRWRFIDAGLELEVAQTHEGWGVPAFADGVEGALDLLHHLTLGYAADSLYLTLGRIADYSIAEGLVVNRYTNRNPYSVFQPIGLRGMALIADVLTVNGFISDITGFDVGGVHAYLRAGGYFVGLGYFYDVNQYHAQPSHGGDRFTVVPDTVPRGVEQQLHVLEMNLGVNIIDDEYVEMRLMGEMAYRFRTLIRSNGYVLRVPQLLVGFRGMQIGAGLHQEYGRMVSSLFSTFYSTNRYRVVNGGADLLTQNGMLDWERRTRGFYLVYRYAPRPGLAFESEYRQDLLTMHVYRDSTLRGRDDYEYHVGVAVNDTLVPFLHEARLGIDHVHGTLYPPGATFSNSWGLRVSAHVLTRPLFKTVAAELGFSYYLLDLDFDNRAGPADRVYEVYGGVHWGFL